MIKKEKKYILIEPEDLITAMQQSRKEKNPICMKMQDLFISNNKINDQGLYKVKNNSDICKYLKTVKGVIFEDEYITLDVIATSLARAIYECNHEMEKSLKKYFRLLIDNKINKEDNKLVIDLILADQKVIDYIRKYDSFDDYVEAIIKKRIYKPNEEKQQTKKNRSYVIM